MLAAPQQRISQPASRTSADEPCIGLRAQHACGAGCVIAIATGTKVPANSNISNALAVALCTFLIKNCRSSIGYNPNVLQIIPEKPAVTEISDYGIHKKRRAFARLLSPPPPNLEHRLADIRIENQNVGPRFLEIQHVRDRPCNRVERMTSNPPQPPVITRNPVLADRNRSTPSSSYRTNKTYAGCKKAGFSSARTSSTFSQPSHRTAITS